MPDSASNFTNPDATEDDKARARRDAQDVGKTAAPDAVDPNGRLYQWGGQYGVADADVKRFQEAQVAAMNRQAAQTDDTNWNGDRGNSQWDRQQQNLAAQQMLARAQGRVPSIAQMQADRQMGQAAAEQASAAASARGPAALALAQQNAAGNTANMQSAISSSAQINAANERLQAEQAASGAYANMRQGDMGSQALDQQNAAFNTSMQMQQRALNDAQQNAMIGHEMNVRTNQMTAQQNYEAAVQSGYFGQAGHNLQQQAEDHAENQDAWNTAVGIGSTALGYLAFASDERTKNVGSWADPEALDARAAQSPTGQYGPASSPAWLDQYMAPQRAPDLGPGFGVAGAPKGYALSRANQPGAMSFEPPASGAAPAPGTADYNAAFAGADARAAKGKPLSDDEQFQRSFSDGKAAASAALDSSGSSKPTAPQAGGDKQAQMQKLIKEGAQNMKQQTHPVDLRSTFVPPQYITSDAHAKELAFQHGRATGMMEADKEAGRPFVIDPGPDPKAAARAQYEADKKAGIAVAIDARSPAQQQADEAQAIMYRASLRHPLTRAQEKPTMLDRVGKRLAGGVDAVDQTVGAPAEDVLSASLPESPHEAVAPVGLASRLSNAARQAIIPSDERGKNVMSDAEAERMKGYADGMRAAMKVGVENGPTIRSVGRGTPENDYNTELNDASKGAYEKWKAHVAPGDPGDDYDYRGAFAEGLTRNGYESHFPDTYKKPNHETFSDESQYASYRPDLAGHWDDDRYVPTKERVLAERAEGLRRAIKIQSDTEPALKGSETPLANAARSMKSQPYTYKPEFTPPDQKPGELNVGPMAQNMAADPVARTAVKKTPGGMLVLDQGKLARLQSATIAEQQEQHDDKEERLRRLEAIAGY